LDENQILHVAMALSIGVSPAELTDTLLGRGMDADEIYLLIVAGQLYLKWFETRGEPNPL
jgi:hypothetical protein